MTNDLKSSSANNANDNPKIKNISNVIQSRSRHCKLRKNRFHNRKNTLKIKLPIKMLLSKKFKIQGVKISR